MISTQIQRITGLRDRIRTKLIALGVLNDNAADLEECTDAVETMDDTSAELTYATSTGNTDTENNYLEIPIALSSLDTLKTLFISSTKTSGFDTGDIITMYLTSRSGNRLTCIAHVVDYDVIGYDFASWMASGGRNMLTIEGYPVGSGVPEFFFDGTYDVYYTYTDGLVGTDEEDETEQQEEQS